MNFRWRLFAGGKNMFYLAIILLAVYVTIIMSTYVFDPATLVYMVPRKNLDTQAIQRVSEKYVSDRHIKIDKPIVYRYVKYHDYGGDDVTVGTFHEWNGKYYIDISETLKEKNYFFEKIIVHETRHMIVEYLKDKKIINLTKHTEAIADGSMIHYNDLFDAGVTLLRISQNKK